VRGKKYPNSKWYDGILNFFSPHYDRIVNIVEANNNIRKSLQLMYKADEPVIDGISRYGDQVNPSSLAEMRGLVTDTSTKLADSRKAIEALYGREIMVMSPIKEAEIRLRDLGKKADDFLQKGGLAKDNELQAGADMDQFERLIEDLWNAKHESDPKWIQAQGKEVHPEYGYIRPASDLHPVQLQIQNPKMRAETAELKSSYYHTTENNIPKNAYYNTKVSWEDEVSYSWTTSETRTVSRQDSNGNTEIVEETYTAYHNASELIPRSYRHDLSASFEEVLSNEVIPDLGKVPLPSASSSGASRIGVPLTASESVQRVGEHFSYIDDSAISQILSNASKTRSAETPFRETILDVQKRIDGLTNSKYQEAIAGKDEKTLTSYRKTNEEDRKKLVSLKNEMDLYAKQNHNQIIGRWSDDKPEVFAQRNSQMQERIDHMIRRLNYVDEQIARRQPSLELEFQLVDYSKTLAPVKAKKDRNQNIMIGVGATSATTALGAILYQGSPEIQEKVDSVAEEVGVYIKKIPEVSNEYQRRWMGQP
jgi:hypothetical protein